MKKHIILLMLLALLVAKMQAQTEIIYEITQWHIGIEAGVNPFFGAINPQANIRENHAFYLDTDVDYYGGFFVNQQLTSFSFGVKPEYLIKKRLALATGIRFQFCKPYLHSDRNYFLWKVSETENSANYIKISSISQKNFYLEVPLEVRLFPREKDHIARHYFIFGTAFNFLIASSHDVQFQNPNMNKYTSQVLAHIGPPNFFQGSVYAGIGLKLGKMNYPFGNIEIHCPTLTFGKSKQNSFTKIDMVGIRFFTTLNIPVNKKQKLTYTVID